MLLDEVDLPLRVDRADTTPVRGQLLEQLKGMIASGHLRPGTPIPSSRALAQSVGVSRNTVVSCYLELEGEGFIESVHGAGTFVADRGSVSPQVGQGRPEPRPVDSKIVDMFPGDVDAGLLSATTWRAMWRRERPSSAPPPAAGIPELRVELASYLGSARGLPCSADEIVLCAGTGEAVVLLALAFGWSAGGVVAVEDPGYPAVRNALAVAGAEWAAFAADDPRAYVAELASLPRTPSAVYLTPSHQYPLGHRLDTQARRELLAWAQVSGAILLEDDYDTEFRFGVPPIGSLAGMAPTADIVYLGTVSKALDPGLRITYLRVPTHLLPNVLAARAALGATVAAPCQWALHELLVSGEFTRHIARVRRIYRDRRRVLVEALGNLPVPAVRGADAGLHLVLDLPTSVDAAALVAEAREQKVLVADLDAFRIARDLDKPGIAIGYSKVNPAQIRQGIGTLGQILRRQLDGPARRSSAPEDTLP